MVQWQLKTPVNREFRYMKKRTVLRDASIPPGHANNPGKLPLMLQVEAEVDEYVVERALADVVRITNCVNEPNNHRLFVRFIYGRAQPDGSCQAPYLDDGVVFSGESYLEHGFQNGVPEEHVLLNKIAALLKWDGAMHVIGDK